MKKRECSRCKKLFMPELYPSFEEFCDTCIELNENERILDDSIALIGKSLNPENAAKFKAMTIEDQRLIATEAWKDGMIKWGPIRAARQENESPQQTT